MTRRIYWMEKATARLLTISARKKLPTIGTFVNLIAKKQKLKVKILSVELSYFDDYYEIYVEIA